MRKDFRGSLQLPGPGRAQAGPWPAHHCQPGGPGACPGRLRGPRGGCRGGPGVSPERSAGVHGASPAGTAWPRRSAVSSVLFF